MEESCSWRNNKSDPALPYMFVTKRSYSLHVKWEKEALLDLMTFMTTVGLLPNLEVLKIQKCDFQVQEMQPTDAVWEPTSGGFCSLRFLLLEKLNLVRWLADKAHFPALRHLVIRGCSALEEIPYGIGDIDTLEIIDLDESSQSALASAKQIQDEQFQLYCKYIKVPSFKNKK